MPDASRRRWACRLAEHLRVGAGRVAGSKNGRLSRWARRHTERCAHCRIEAAESVSVEALLRRAGSAVAPPHLYEAVMARIAGSPSRTAAGSGKDGARRHRLRARLDAPSLPVVVGAAFAACLIAIVAAHSSVTPWPEAFAAASSVVTLWWEYALSVVSFVRADWADVGAAVAAAAAAVAPGVQPYVSALLWTGVGLAITAALIRGPRWLRLPAITLSKGRS